MSWMVRFTDGPYKGQQRKIPGDPPDELVMFDRPDIGVVGIDGPDYDTLPEGSTPEEWGEPTRYRRIPDRTSKLPADDPMVTSGLMIRGAEYELAKENA